MNEVKKFQNEDVQGRIIVNENGKERMNNCILY
jgi:hypothetical protein